MDLHKPSLTDLLTVQQKSYIVPHFQREYKWDQDNWNDLFNDIVRAYEKGQNHFIGAIVLQKGENDKESIIIDGQQRLATLSILLCAFAKYVKDYNPGNKFLYNEAIKNFLYKKDFQGDEAPRLSLSSKSNNLGEFNYILNSFYKSDLCGVLTSEKKLLTKCHEYFYESFVDYFSLIDDDINDFVMKFFNVTTNKLRFISIILNNNEDPNMIFETLNTRGKDLEHGDLIRNFLFMKNDPEILNVYLHHWQPLEQYFEKIEEKSFSDFLRYYLYANKDDARTIRNKHIYPEMKDFFNQYLDDHTLNELIENIAKYKNHFDIILKPFNYKNDNKYNKKILNALYVLKLADLAIYTPIILKLFDLYNDGNISKVNFEAIILKITSYGIRLSLDDKRAPNKLIPEIVMILSSFSDENDIEEDIETSLVRQKTSPFYTNDKFTEVLKGNNIYTPKRRNLIAFILLLVINEDSNQKLSYSNINDLTLEHIFPQKPEKWKSELTEDAITLIHTEYLHTIGNLTLINQSLNSELSNRIFKEKRHDLEKYSIWYNEREKYFKNDIWDKNSILSRSKDVADIFIKVFPGPNKLSTNITYNNFYAIIDADEVRAKTQKESYIKVIEKLNEISDPKIWKTLKIKGCASYDRTDFTKHQLKSLIEKEGIFFNYHASLREKIRKIEKISKHVQKKIKIELY